MNRNGSALGNGIGRYSAVVLILIGSMFATACAAEAGRSAGSLLPSDLAHGADTARVDAARGVLEARCMSKAGYPQLEQAGRPALHDPFEGLVISEAAYGPASEQVARTKGFGEDRASVPRQIVSFDQSFDKALDGCTGQAWTELGAGGEQTLLTYYNEANGMIAELIKVRQDFESSSAYSDAFDGQMRCMSANGFRADDPHAFRGDGRWEHFGVTSATQARSDSPWEPTDRPGTVQVGPGAPAVRYQPAAAESALAVAWYRCNQESGFAKGQVEALLAKAPAIAEKHAEVFAELNPRLAQLVAAAARATGGN